MCVRLSQVIKSQLQHISVSTKSAITLLLNFPGKTIYFSRNASMSQVKFQSKLICISVSKWVCDRASVCVQLLSLSFCLSFRPLVYGAVNLLCWPQTSCRVSSFSCNVIIFYIILILIFNLWLQLCHARHGERCVRVCVCVLVWVDCCQPRWSTHARTHTRKHNQNRIQLNLI